MNENESISTLNGTPMPNQSVESTYHLIIEKISSVISQVPSEDMRKALVPPESDVYSHSLLSPLILLRLSKDKQMIGFAIDLELKDYLGRQQYHKLFRILYECTHLTQDCLDQFEYCYSEYEEALDNPYATESLIETTIQGH